MMVAHIACGCAYVHSAYKVSLHYLWGSAYIHGAYEVGLRCLWLCLHARCIQGVHALSVAVLTYTVYTRLACVVSGCASVRDAYEVGLRGLSVLTWIVQTSLAYRWP